MLASTVRNTQALIIHLSASFYPLLEEIAETREADRDATVNEKQLVAVEGQRLHRPTFSSEFLPKFWVFLRISAKILPQKARNHDICDKKSA